MLVDRSRHAANLAIDAGWDQADAGAEMFDSQRRTHIVLVPGFGGFDALGQIFYYAGVTVAFQEWRTKRRAAGLPDPAIALHYFENLPTAGVQSRAMALRAFLEERAFRSIFEPGDRVALVGHSTGGLDIRQLLVNLNPRFPPPFREAATDVLVSDADLLARIERLVFLSVPQRGTNIADFARRIREPIQRSLANAEFALRASHRSFLDKLERFVLSQNLLPQETPQLFAAIRDAILETLPGNDATSAEGRYQAALARAAYGELIGWLDNVKSDFFAVDDLASEFPEAQLPTPARYDQAVRGEELAAWSDRSVRTRSFATIGNSPYDVLPRTRTYKPSEFPKLLANFWPDHAASTDFVYRLAYAATAAGPFAITPGNDMAVENGERRSVMAWENDGIVNTASMLWPDAEQTELVHGDHGDIIGHYRLSLPLTTAEAVSGRLNHSYDILRSSSGFDKPRFDGVWHGVFEFCAEP
ncbi:MAG TPA: hypothetical protein VH142_21020 [Polyangiaceae bacterium]|jgi:hypothetical protein|nr:hypothetical protein [Polyangiaceae bacterium]